MTDNKAPAVGEGFTCLYPGGPKPRADVVFVHGLGGHPQRTWSTAAEPQQPRASAEDGIPTRPSKKIRWFRAIGRRSKGKGLQGPEQPLADQGAAGSDNETPHANSKRLPAAKEEVFWPRDLLPVDISDVRVMTFGYSSSPGGSGQDNLYTLSMNLLGRLANERTEEPNRPIIFIAHSLGGILTKFALKISQDSTGADLWMKTIRDSTRGVIFFGTPHSGLDMASWGELLKSIVVAENKHEAVVKFFFNAEGVNVDSKNVFNQTPLFKAAERGHEAVVKLLLSVERVDADSKDNQSRTPLYRAAANGYEAVVKLLLNTKRVNVNSKSKFNETPLLQAAKNGHEAVVKLLLSAEGVDVNSKNGYGYNGETPLFQASFYGREAVVELLLSAKGIDVNSRNGYPGETPLFKAAASGHDAIVKLLLSAKGIDVNSKNGNRDETPLFQAAASGHDAVVKLLLSAEGVDVNSKNKYDKRTPLFQAATRGHNVVVKLLLSAEGVNVNSKTRTAKRRCFERS